jgi:hypothetical protein
MTRDQIKWITRQRRGDGRLLILYLSRHRAMFHVRYTHFGAFFDAKKSLGVQIG